MSDFAFTSIVHGQLEEVCSAVSEKIKAAGFGVLTRIDFDKKIKEKTGKDINPCIILGACNPQLVYEAYMKSTDVTLLVPCNIVLTEIEPGKIKVEAMRPSQMLKMLPISGMTPSIDQVEQNLQQALRTLGPA